MNEQKVTELFGDHIWYDKKRIWGLPISFTTYVLTNERLHTRRGFLNIKEDQLDLYKVADISAEFPLGQRIFGCGTIILTGADRDTPVKKIFSVKEPRAVLRKLEEIITAERKKYFVAGRDMIGTAFDNHHGHHGF